MEQQATPEYHAGYQAGMNADQAMDDFEMFQYVDDFVLGYVVGYSEMESFRRASPTVWSWQAGELGRLYRVPFEELEQFINPQEDFDGSLRRALHDSYYGSDPSSPDDFDQD